MVATEQDVLRQPLDSGTLTPLLKRIVVTVVACQIIGVQPEDRAS